MSIRLLAAAVLLGTVAPASAAQLIVNGGFENTAFGGTTSYYDIGVDHGVPGDFGFAVTDSVDIIANGAFAAYLPTGGAYNLDLVGYGSTGAISQTFNTVAGKTYSVSLAYTENGTGRVADVSVNGSAIGTLTGTPAWQTFTKTFTGTGAPTTFAITETVGGGNAGVVLDNISVTAVPEPASWAMMVAGFALIGFAARRRGAAIAA